MRGRTRVPAAVLPDKGQDISLDGFNLRINMVLGNTLVGTAILVCYSFPVRDFIAVGMPIAEHPRTDPGERDSRTGLPPWVVNGESHEQGESSLHACLLACMLTNPFSHSLGDDILLSPRPGTLQLPLNPDPG